LNPMNKNSFKLDEQQQLLLVSKTTRSHRPFQIKTIVSYSCCN
jgi:hypothetical protein